MSRMDRRLSTGQWHVHARVCSIVKEFMQVSSIHGFGHIVATRRFSRLFWILAVIFGFSVSSYLIQVSFSSWSESPVSTTIETLPISKIKFPQGKGLFNSPRQNSGLWSSLAPQVLDTNKFRNGKDPSPPHKLLQTFAEAN